jgi:5-methylcytosine-specific restriction endonuclease McrA
MVCHLCGGAIPSLDDLHMDHVIPLILGGPHAADNIRPAHAFCNLSKGGRLIP